MAADRDRILETIQSYVDLVGKGTADEILALYAEGATVEDPVGTDVRTTRESIHEFYAAIEPLRGEPAGSGAEVADGQAALPFRAGHPGRRPDLHARADRRDDVRRRRPDHEHARVLEQRRHGGRLSDWPDGATLSAPPTGPPPRIAVVG